MLVVCHAELLVQIEYILVVLDEEKREAKLSLRGPEILDQFMQEEIALNKEGYVCMQLE